MNYNYLLGKYKQFGDRFLLTKDSKLFIFSDRDRDYVFETTHSYKISKNIFLAKDNFKITQKNIDELIVRLETCTSDEIVDSFLLRSKYVEIMRKELRERKSTHLRFFNQDDKVRINMFDYRKFLSDVIPVKGQNLSIATLQLPGQISESFGLTISALSFLRLENIDYDVEVLENKRITFTSLDEKKYFIFHFQHQGFEEPIIQFQHDTLNKNVSLLYQPSKSILNSF